MRFSDDLLLAYIRGELAEPAHAAVERAMRVDPVLSIRLAELRLRHGLACGVSANGHGGARQSQRIKQPTSAKVVHLDTLRPARALPPSATAPAPVTWQARHWGALALAVLLGAILGIVLWRSLAPTSSLVRLDASGAALVARGALAAALDGRSAANQSGAPDIRIGTSFVSSDGGYCRTFTTHATAGLACVMAGRWTVPVLVQRPLEATGEAGALPPAVRAAIAERIVGSTLDPAAERAAAERSWQR